MSSFRTRGRSSSIFNVPALRRIALIVLGIGFLCSPFHAGKELMAIPAFARKYDQSCTTCHMGFPALNTFGEAFRYNGYRFPMESDEEVKEKPIKLGQKAQKILFPRHGVYPGEMPAAIPVSLRIEMDVRARDFGPVRSEFQFPHEIEVLSAGNFGESFSFYLNMPVFEDGEFGGVDRAFLQFHRLLNAYASLNVKVGQFEIAAAPYTNWRRHTVDPYIVSDMTFGNVPFTFEDPQKGVELWGIFDRKGGGGAFYGVGVVNGTARPGQERNGFSDADSDKDFYARFYYKWGGMTLRGEDGLVPQGGNWHDNSLRLGTFGYRGSIAGESFTRVGWDARYRREDLVLFSALLLGRNDREQAGFGSRRAYFIESNYFFLPWMIGAMRYEGYRDLGMDGEGRSILAHVSIYPRPNIALRVEGVEAISPAGRFSFRLRFDNGF